MISTAATFAQTLTLAFVSSFASAQGSRNNAEFAEWAARHGKTYGSVEEFHWHGRQFDESRLTVDALNAHARSKGLDVEFAVNDSADLTEEEYVGGLGLVAPGIAVGGVTQNDLDRFFGRRRSLENAIEIDWVANNVMQPVKDQAKCAACWAFAAATTAEAMLAIRDGTAQTETDADSKRLSEQQAIDCATDAFGCYGGFMENAWEYWKTAGAMYYSDYPYTATHRNVCPTPHDGEQLEFVDEYGLVTGGATEMLERLAHGPLTVGVSAGNRCWRFYKKGVITEAMGCPTNIDHAVVLVGYHVQALAKGGSTSTGAVSAYWTIQNSKGTRWGDQGYMKLEVSSGVGVSGINSYVQWVTMK